jgi:hypothetical protein
MAAIFWFRLNKKNLSLDFPYIKAEIILLSVSCILATFVKSTVISNNDFGWRAWLPGQFVLLIWGADLLHGYFKNANGSLQNLFAMLKTVEKKSPLLALALIIGLITTLANATYLRTWPFVIDAGLTMPLMLSEDAHLGERTYAAKQAYIFIAQNIPSSMLIQNNPTINLDRPLGLYGNRQVVISNVAPYGIPDNEFKSLVNKVKPIFLSQNISSWNQIDQVCEKYLINILVISDQDPLWSSLPVLQQQRKAFYKNNYYAIYACGSSVQP